MSDLILSTPVSAANNYAGYQDQGMLNTVQQNPTALATLETLPQQNLSGLDREQLLAMLTAQNPALANIPNPPPINPILDTFTMVSPFQTAQVYIIQNGQAVNTGTSIYVSQFINLQHMQGPQQQMDMLPPPKIIIDGVLQPAHEPLPPAKPGENPYIPGLVLPSNPTLTPNFGQDSPFGLPPQGQVSTFGPLFGGPELGSSSFGPINPFGPSQPPFGGLGGLLPELGSGAPMQAPPINPYLPPIPFAPPPPEVPNINSLLPLA